MLGNEEWKRFIKSGKIEDYMKYKNIERKPEPKAKINVKSENVKPQDNNLMG